MNKYTYLQTVVPRLMAGAYAYPTLDIPFDWYLAAPEAAQRAAELLIRCNNAPIEFTAHPNSRVARLTIMQATSPIIIGNIPELVLRLCQDLTSDTFQHAQNRWLTLATCTFRNNALTMAPPVNRLDWTDCAGDLTVLGPLTVLFIGKSSTRWTYTATQPHVHYMDVCGSIDDVIPITGVQPRTLSVNGGLRRQSIAPLLWDGLLRIPTLNVAYVVESDLFAIVNLPGLAELNMEGSMPEKTFIDMASTLLFRLRKRPADSPTYHFTPFDLQLTPSTVPSVPKWTTLSATVRKIVDALNNLPDVYVFMPKLVTKRTP